MFYWIVFAAVVALFALAIYARHRSLRDEPPRPGYLIPPGEPGSWYETYTTNQGRVMTRPTEKRRRAWEQELESDEPKLNQ